MAMRKLLPWLLFAALSLSVVGLARWRLRAVGADSGLPGEEAARAAAERTPARPHAAGENAVTVRGKKQEVYFYPAAEPRLNRSVLFVPGDGGWRGNAVTIGQTMAS